MIEHIIINNFTNDNLLIPFDYSLFALRRKIISDF